MEKKLIAHVEQVTAERLAQTVEVWAVDEARIGLQPILRRMWAKRAKRPTAVVEPKYEWLWLYAAVHPASGRVFWLILPRLDKQCVAAFLAEFARTHAQGGDKQVVLVWDGAPGHRAVESKLPANITIARLPPYTPELNPAERLWSKVKEATANQWHKTLDELEDKVAKRCVELNGQSKQIRQMTRYYWWNFD